MEKKQIFLGSRADNETELDHIIREAQWKEDHSCPMCGNFECDGYCNEREI